MTKINIEMVDEILERLPFVSYKDAKEALVKADGDVLDAIIILENYEEKSERNNFEKFEGKVSQEADKLRNQLSNLLREATTIRVAVKKEEKVILNIPLTVGVVGIAAMPLVTLLGLSAAVLSNYSVNIVDENSDEEVDLGTLTPEKIDLLKEMIIGSFGNIKDTFLRKNKNNDFDENLEDDITDELMEDDDIE